MPLVSRAPTAEDQQSLHRALREIEGGEALSPLFRDLREWVELEAGDVLVRQGDHEASLYLLVAGGLEALRGGRDDGAERVATLTPPQIVGELQLLMGGVRSATLKATERTLLARVAPDEFERAVSLTPGLWSTLSTRALARLRRDRLSRILTGFLETNDPDLVNELAAEADWITLGGGEVLVEEGEPGGDVFVLIEGRLRARQPSAGNRTLGDLAPGDVVGETQMFTGGRRQATVTALRDSSLARLTRPRIEAAIRREPDLGLRLASIAVERALRTTRPARPRRGVNVAVVGDDAALRDLCAERLTRALGAHGQVGSVSRAVVARELGQADLCDLPPRDPRATRLNMWLSDQESRQSFLVLSADDSNEWQERCLSYADIVLRVTVPGAPPASLVSEGLVDRTQARRWLVVLHGAAHAPQGTSAWGAQSIERYFHVRKDEASDFARLARAVAGREVGLVLGGGGARGYAHLGTIRAMIELGIPIDAVCGTSAGAAVASFFAAGLRDQELEDTMKSVLGGWVDYTLPIVSLTAGGSMLKRTRRVFGSLEIEDLAIPFFCIATDISRFGMLVVDRGPVADAMMASSCLPGVFPPVNVNGSWVVDGALVNAIPVDIMRGLIGPSGVVIASDVSAGGAAPVVKAAPGASGVGGWKQLLRTLQGRRAHPFIADVLQRSVTAAGDHQFHRSMQTGYPDLCIRHDTLGYSVIDFSKPAPLREKGYATSMESFRPLLESGALRGVLPTPSN